MMQRCDTSHPTQHANVRKSVPPQVGPHVARDAQTTNSNIGARKRYVGLERVQDLTLPAFVPIEPRSERGDINAVPWLADGSDKRKDFHLRDLPLPFETPPNIALPPVDDYGWPTGEKHEAILEARTPMSIGTRATMPGVKYCRRFEILSMGELAVQIAHMFNPYVIDLREQYPVYDPEDFWRANASRQRMLRKQVMTIDLVLTYVVPPSMKLRYHAISVKHAGYVPSPKDLAREGKEREAMNARGWTWELMRANQIPRIEVENYMLLHSLVRHTNVPSLYEAARIFARCLNHSSAKGKMSSIVKRVAKRLRIEPDEGFRLFAVAVAYGFITLDHSRRLKLHEPLALIS